MINFRLFIRTARKLRRDGFTLVELLVVIGIIAILAGVALGPITNGIKQAKHNAALQTGRQIGQVCFSYSTDNTQNGNAYPAADNAVDLAQLLINASYVQDPSIFQVSGQSGLNATPVKVNGQAITLDKSNVSWCFTVQSLDTTGGINSNASDLIPLIYFNNGFGIAPTGVPWTMTPGTAINVTYGDAAPFKTDGAAVFYKGNNALYLKAGTQGTVGQIAGFISANCTDTTTYQVAQ